jgi:hypothetical protein
MCDIQEAREAGYGIKSEIYGRDSHSLFRNNYHLLEVARKECSGYKTTNICALFTVAINKNILRKTNSS